MKPACEKRFFCKISFVVPFGLLLTGLYALPLLATISHKTPMGRNPSPRAQHGSSGGTTSTGQVLRPMRISEMLSHCRIMREPKIFCMFPGGGVVARKQARDPELPGRRASRVRTTQLNAPSTQRSQKSSPGTFSSPVFYSIKNHFSDLSVPHIGS